MRLGAALPFADLSGGPLGPRSLAVAARTIERLGYDSIWTFDVIGRGFMVPDPLMALAAAAGATERVDLGTGIMQLPIRNVAEVAHRLFTLELLAPGRVLFGVGPGSSEFDFAVYGGDHGDRFARFDEQWTELQRWVREGAIGDRDLTPWPAVLDGPSLVLAAWRGKWVERAAAEASAWIASALHNDDEVLADAIARYRAAGGQRAIAGSVQVGPDVGPTVERLGHLADLGFDDAVVFDVLASEQRLAEIREAVS